MEKTQNLNAMLRVELSDITEVDQLVSKMKGSVRKTIPVTGMHCASCVLDIEKELKKLEGVKDARASYLTEKVSVDYDPEKVDLSSVENKIEYLGYKIAYKKYEGALEKLSKIFRRRKAEEKSE